MPSNKTVKILIDIDAKGVKSLTKAGKSFEVMGKKADKTSKSLKTFGKVSAKLSQGLKTMAVGLVAASAGLVIATKSALKSADSIAKTADKIGLTTDSLQELRVAASLTGVSQGKLDSSMERFVKRIGEAAAGTGAAKKMYEQLGIAVVNTDGSLRNSDLILNDVANSIKGMRSEAERAAATAALFGREGVALALTLKDGSAGLDAYRLKAQELGIVIDESLLRGAESANDAMDLLGKSIKASVTTALLELAPTIQNVAETLISFLPVIKSVLNIFIQFSPVLLPLIIALGAFSAAWFLLINPIMIIVGLFGSAGLAGVFVAIGPIIAAVVAGLGLLWAGFKAGPYVVLGVVKAFEAIPKAVKFATDLAVKYFNAFLAKIKAIVAKVKAAIKAIVGAKDKADEPQGKKEGGAVQKLKHGGKLSGYGGGDRIRALLEAGEFVVRKEAVAKYGSGFMTAINGLKMPTSEMKFQAGGAVPDRSQTNNFNFSAPINATGGNAQSLENLFRKSILPQFKSALKSNTGSITTALRRYV